MEPDPYLSMKTPDLDVYQLCKAPRSDNSVNFDNEERLDKTSSERSDQNGIASHSRSNSKSTIASSVESTPELRLLPQLEPSFTTILAADQTEILLPNERQYLIGKPEHIRLQKLEEVSGFLALLDTLKKGVAEIHIDGEWTEGVMTDLEIKFVSRNITYCLDMVQLGPAVFDEPSAGGRTLRNILEDPLIPVSIYDIRGDQYIMFHQYGLVMNGVIDLQILFLVAQCSQGSFYLPGLGKAVKSLFLNKDELKEWEENKRKGRKFCDKYGFSMFLRRALHPTLQKYAAGDTEYMGHIYAYSMSQPRMKSALLQDLVLMISEKRVTEAISPEYNPDDANHSKSPVEYQTLSHTVFGLEEPAWEDEEVPFYT